MKWQKVVRLKFGIKLEEGTRIGGSGGGIEIGELVDANLSAIRNPANNEFYIPGSSLKGKLRSVLERELDKTSGDGREPCACGRPDCIVCNYFWRAQKYQAGMRPDAHCCPRFLHVWRVEKKVCRCQRRWQAHRGVQDGKHH